MELTNINEGLPKEDCEVVIRTTGYHNNHAIANFYTKTQDFLTSDGLWQFLYSKKDGFSLNGNKITHYAVITY